MKRMAVIMAGGAGERFWPVSRRARPKQLLRLCHPDMSLLEEAVERVTPLFGKDGVFIATGKSVEEPIRESGAVEPSHIWVEPLKRNTLGALCWVAASILATHEENVSLAVLTADHRIGPADTFRNRVGLALDTAEERGALVTIGIPPTRPETGFGYIEVDAASEGPKGVFSAKSFREKPDRATAEGFIEKGTFLWNSGMFFWTLHDFLRELEGAKPEAHGHTRKISDALRSGDSEEAERHFADLPNISVDFALMEKAQNVAVVASDFEWDDVGAWDALERTMEADASQNVVFGDAVITDSSGCVIYNDSRALVSVLGMEDALVVATHDAILVCPKSEAQRVREIVEKLKAARSELT